MLMKCDKTTLPLIEDGKKVSCDEISFRINLTPFHPLFKQKMLTITRRLTRKNRP